MLVEFTVINSLPPNEEGSSIARYIPKTIYQKKMFNTDMMLPEEYVDHSGKTDKKYTLVKIENDYFKLNIPYEELKDKYYKPLVVGGLNAKRTNYTDI